MQIRPNKISKVFNNFKYNCKERQINKYFRLHDFDTYGDSYNQLYNVRGMLANYAKSKKVSIDVYKPNEIRLNEIDPKNESNCFSRMLDVVITDRKTKKQFNGLVPANTDKTQTHVTKKNYIIFDTPEDTQYVRIVKSEHEDNFLRTFYRNIENMVASVKNFK